MSSLGCELSEHQICRVLVLVKEHSEQKCSITPEVLKRLIRKAKEEQPGMSTLSEKILGAPGGEYVDRRCGPGICA